MLLIEISILTRIKVLICHGQNTKKMTYMLHKIDYGRSNVLNGYRYHRKATGIYRIYSI